MKTELKTKVSSNALEVRKKCDECKQYCTIFYHNNIDGFKFECIHCGIRYNYIIRPPNKSCKCE